MLGLPINLNDMTMDQLSHLLKSGNSVVYKGKVYSSMGGLIETITRQELDPLPKTTKNISESENPLVEWVNHETEEI